MQCDFQTVNSWLRWSTSKTWQKWLWFVLCNKLTEIQGHNDISNLLWKPKCKVSLTEHTFTFSVQIFSFISGLFWQTLNDLKTKTETNQNQSKLFCNLRQSFDCKSAPSQKLQFIKSWKLLLYGLYWRNVLNTIHRVNPWMTRLWCSIMYVHEAVRCLMQCFSIHESVYYYDLIRAEMWIN